MNRGQEAFYKHDKKSEKRAQSLEIQEAIIEHSEQLSEEQLVILVERGKELDRLKDELENKDQGIDEEIQTIKNFFEGKSGQEKKELFFIWAQKRGYKVLLDIPAFEDILSYPSVQELIIWILKKSLSAEELQCHNGEESVQRYILQYFPKIENTWLSNYLLEKASQEDIIKNKDKFTSINKEIIFKRAQKIDSWTKTILYQWIHVLNWNALLEVPKEELYQHVLEELGKRSVPKTIKIIESLLALHEEFGLSEEDFFEKIYQDFDNPKVFLEFFNLNWEEDLNEKEEFSQKVYTFIQNHQELKKLVDAKGMSFWDKYSYTVKKEALKETVDRLKETDEGKERFLYELRGLRSTKAKFSYEDYQYLEAAGMIIEEKFIEGAQMSEMALCNFRRLPQELLNKYIPLVDIKSLRFLYNDSYNRVPVFLITEVNTFLQKVQAHYHNEGFLYVLKENPRWLKKISLEEIKGFFESFGEDELSRQQFVDTLLGVETASVRSFLKDYFLKKKDFSQLIKTREILSLNTEEIFEYIVLGLRKNPEDGQLLEGLTPSQVLPEDIFRVLIETQLLVLIDNLHRFDKEKIKEIIHTVEKEIFVKKNEFITELFENNVSFVMNNISVFNKETLLFISDYIFNEEIFDQFVFEQVMPVFLEQGVLDHDQPAKVMAELAFDYSKEFYEELQKIESGEESYLREEFNLQNTGKKGLVELQEKIKEKQKDVYRNEDSFEDSINHEFTKKMYMGAVRFESSQWGIHTETEFIRTIQRYFALGELGEIRPLPEAFETARVEVKRRDIRNFSFQEGTIQRFETMKTSLRQAIELLEKPRGLSKLIQAMEGKRENMIQDLKDRIEVLKEQGKDRAVQAMERMIEDLNKVTLRNIKDFQKNFEALANKELFHEELRQLSFYITLLEHHSLKEQAKEVSFSQKDPDVEQVMWMYEFIDHTLKKETWSKHISQKSAKKLFKKIMNTNAFSDELERLSSQGSREVRNMEIIPTRGPLMEFSGHIGDACWASKYPSISKQFPNFSSLIFIQEPGTKFERSAGSTMMIETEAADGTPLLVIRGLNPIQNVITNLVEGDFFKQVVNYTRKVAEKMGRKVAIVLDDHAGGSGTNRPNLYEFLDKERYKWEKKPLASNEDTNFNGYDIVNKVYLIPDELYRENAYLEEDQEVTGEETTVLFSHGGVVEQEAWKQALQKGFKTE